MKSYSANVFVSLLTTDQQQQHQQQEQPQNNFDDYSESSRDINELDQELNLSTVIVNNPSDSSTKAILNKEDTRETWSNNCDYLITTLGGLIGLGSLYRFPYLAFENGGAAFVIPYVLICVLCGIPLLMMETALGQFSRKGPVGCWDFAPAMRGIGIASVVVSFFGALYYIMIMVWGGLYLYHSFSSIGSPLPWSDDVGDIPFTNNTKRITNSVEHFWNTTILNISEDFGGLSTFHWPSVIGLLIMWTIVYLCLWKGIKLTSRVAVFTTIFPYLPMLALFIRGMTLDGAWSGLRYYLIPDPQRLLNKKAWIQAAGHVLWAYGIGWGTIPALSSYNRPDYNFYNDIVITGITSILTNVFSGFVVFPVLGFMSHKANVSIEQVVSSGPGLAFIVYPKAISLMPLPHFWAITFFCMIFLLGIDSQFVTCESVLTATLDKLDQWYDRSPKRRKIRREFVVAIYVLISFAFGLLMATRAGFYIFNIFDGYVCGAISLLIICIVQLATVLFAYRTTFSSWHQEWPPSQWPGQTFIRHISEVLKRRLTYIWVCWVIIVPIWLFGMLAIALRTIGPISYETFIYPLSFQIIGYILTSIAPLSILVYFIYYQLKNGR
ncbi:unnamed protein product [Adineta steineri]|uniref:Transporter n=1 Tax=Adineta steineri TaxID=433720 RepID=A0A813MCB6_9BILA|nr:unnamed protein product [Adineta steineri]CAF3735431.1 unnamed protein product [Adineta steineri]